MFLVKPPKPMLFGPPSYNGERCSKCGNTSSGVYYDRSVDLLRVHCFNCGHDWTRQPLDKTEAQA